MLSARQAPRAAVIFDWDQTVTRLDKGTNQAATHFGFNYFFMSQKEIVADCLLMGFADLLNNVLDDQHVVMISTRSHQQLIRHALKALIGERANDIVIASAKPKNLYYFFRVHINPHVPPLSIPLHTKNIKQLIERYETCFREIASEVTMIEPIDLVPQWQRELDEACAEQGIDDDWANLYEKDAWKDEDVRFVIDLMRSVGVDSIDIRTSEYQHYTWHKLMGVFSDFERECSKILYVDNSERRLEAFKQLMPNNTSVPVVTFLAQPEVNEHFIQILQALGKPHQKLNLDDMTMPEAAWLQEQLRQEPVRMKGERLSKTGLHRFFAGPSAVKVLTQTAVKLSQNQLMLIGDAPKGAGRGEFSKVKTATIYQTNREMNKLTLESEGVVKIYFRQRPVDDPQLPEWHGLATDYAFNIRSEANLFRRFNNLTPDQVSVQSCFTDKGLRVYFRMPDLGWALSEYIQSHNLELVDILNIFKCVFDQLEKIHAEDYVHFDISLHNILYNDKLKRVSICDFAHARRASTVPPRINSTITPPVYPETKQADIHFGKSFDIFSVGVCMAKCLGFKPYTGVLQEMVHDNIFLRRAVTHHTIASLDEGIIDSTLKVDVSVSKATTSSYASDMMISGHDTTKTTQPRQPAQPKKSTAPRLISFFQSEGSAPLVYWDPKQLFDFNSSPHNVDDEIIETLQLMLHPDPRQRETAAIFSILLSTLILAYETREAKNTSNDKYFSSINRFKK